MKKDKYSEVRPFVIALALGVISLLTIAVMLEYGSRIGFIGLAIVFWLGLTLFVIIAGLVTGGIKLGKK